MRELGRKGGRSRETALRKEVRVDDELREQAREVLAKALRGEEVPKAALDSARSLFSYRADQAPVQQRQAQQPGDRMVFGIGDLLRVAIERGIVEVEGEVRIGGELVAREVPSTSRKLPADEKEPLATPEPVPQQAPRDVLSSMTDSPGPDVDESEAGHLQRRYGSDPPEISWPQP
jgi:hypothetical protein